MGIKRDRFNNIVAVEYTFATTNNVLDPINLDIGKGECQLIENIDITPGTVARRAGYTQVHTDSIHSGWSSPTRNIAFYVKAGVLTQYDGSVERAIKTIGSTRCCFVEINDVVAFTNGLEYGLIQDGTYYAPVVPNEPFKVAVPSGNCLCFYNGRIYVAKGNLLYCTDPFTAEYCDERFNVVGSYDSNISIVAKVDDGLLVGTDTEIFFLQGADPYEGGFSNISKADYGAVAGTDIEIKDGILAKGTGTCVMFSSKRGICLVTSGGSFSNITQDYFTYPYGSIGTAILRYSEGFPYYLANTTTDYEAFNQETLPTLDIDSI